MSDVKTASKEHRHKYLMTPNEDFVADRAFLAGAEWQREQDGLDCRACESAAFNTGHGEPMRCPKHSKQEITPGQELEQENETLRSQLSDLIRLLSEGKPVPLRYLKNKYLNKEIVRPEPLSVHETLFEDKHISPEDAAFMRKMNKPAPCSVCGQVQPLCAEHSSDE